MGGSVAKEKLSTLTEHLPHGAVSFHCAMLGLDSAGKTTALYRLKFDQYMNAAPTIGFNCEKVRERDGVDGGRGEQKARGIHLAMELFLLELVFIRHARLFYHFKGRAREGGLFSTVYILSE